MLSAMLTAKKQRKIMTPVMVEYADVDDPTMRRMIPAANTRKLMARLAFLDMTLTSFTLVVNTFLHDQDRLQFDRWFDSCSGGQYTLRILALSSRCTCSGDW